MADRDINLELGAISGAVRAGSVAMTIVELTQRELVSEFDREVVEHPEWAEQLPREAHGVLHVEGEAACHRWARQVAERHAEGRRPLVVVTIKRLEPVRSRITDLELTMA